MTTALTPELDAMERLIPPQLRGRTRDTFFVQSAWNPIAAGGDVTNRVQMEADADFLLIGASAVATTQADLTALLAFFPYLLTISVATSGRDLMNEEAHVENIVARGASNLRNALWLSPKWVPGNSTLRLRLRSQHGAATVVRLTLHGFKLFR